MQLDLTRYRQPVSQFGRTFQPNEVEQEGDVYRIVAPVQVNLEIHKDKDRFRLTGTAKTELELQCSRCLDPFRLPFEGEIDVRYLPASAMSTRACQLAISASRSGLERSVGMASDGPAAVVVSGECIQ